jgi:TRAP-type mannitol/chloroaromatic compound transport system permease small subunit/NADH:ubiquinone oxidoreductase subunit 6 (subunit J)
MADLADAAHGAAPSDRKTRVIFLCRSFAWCMVAAMTAFLINNYLNYWQGWPSATSVFTTGTTTLGLVQVVVYLAAVAAGITYVVRTGDRSLRDDSEVHYRIAAFIVRAGFWAVVFIGVADMVISFLRVENLLPDIVGNQMTIDLGRSSYRGTWVHFPMAFLGIVFAVLWPRTLGFTWLALLVVVAELLIVFSRFIFSYEQAFMSDLVRFWYGSLFLFASAYTLLEEGHVRVDVFYAGFSERKKGLYNAIGCVVLGMSLCWVILAYGMGSQAAVINSPLLSFEVTQTGFGMYVKYWMAGFLAIYAVSMMIQFCGYFLESVADIYGDPGKRQLETGVAHETYET